MTERDSACTPRWLTELLPEVDIDPCSNPRSTVRAKKSIMLPGTPVPLDQVHSLQRRGFAVGNGLDEDWEGKILGINGPFSDLSDFAFKVTLAREFWFLCNLDPSTKWWRFVTIKGRHRFEFHERLEYEAPPGVTYSSNDRVSCLLATDGMRDSIGTSLDRHGLWWTKGTWKIHNRMSTHK